MLFARGGMTHGRVAYASAFFVERVFRVFVVERRGSLWDTRFVPGAARGPAERRSLSLLLDGWVRFHGKDGPTVRAPVAVVTPSPPIDGPIITSGATLTAGGEPFTLVQLDVAAPFWAGPERSGPAIVAPSDDLLLAATELLAATAVDARARVERFLTTCAGQGLVRADIVEQLVAEEPAAYRRTWAAFSECYLSVTTAPSLQVLSESAGVSLRQLARDIEEILTTFDLGWTSFREAVGDLRLRWALLLLSDEETPVADVARAAGYGSTAALDRALRDRGLPSPSEARRRIREGMTDPIQ